VHSSELRAVLDRAPVSEAAEELRRVWPTVAARALRTMGAARAALVLERLAEDDAALAAGLLDACNTRILLRPPEPGSEPEWWLHDCPAAAILSALDLGLPSSAALVTAVPQAQLELMLEHAPASVRSALDHYRQQEAGSHLRFPLEVMGVAKGRRQSRTLDGGLRWVHIEEDLDTGVSVKPVIIDLLEMELDRVRLVARMATDDETALPAARAAEVFEGYRATGRRPENRDFATLGLTQLSEAVKTAGALAAINGNFYFDYGHYLNGVTLGIDIANVPGLFFGDPIGWFVAEGTELIPPAFNRAAGVVTEDGDFHFERVFMTHVAFGNGQTVRWDTLNVAKTPGRTSAYTSLFGYRTQAGGSHVDLAIARGRIWTIAGQGDQVIPLTGFVLSIPVELATRVLAGVGPGDAVEVGNDFPAGRGRVAEAMACGPSLVRDGAVDLDFTDEDFGQQDSTVMSFFLPRTVETYEAARSFVARRGSTLILGTVSGTAYGFGRSTVSGGMTFGEMAQLCLDLGADHAYALDGGGSSSLVARDNGQVKVLNTPTGGADVVQGDERFINTYWLVFQR